MLQLEIFLREASFANYLNTKYKISAVIGFDFFFNYLNALRKNIDQNVLFHDSSRRY